MLQFDLNQLRHFLAVVEENTVSAAAEKLNITQPALSRSLMNLESALGVELFERKRSKISVNETGLKAAEIAKSLLEQAESFQNQVADFYNEHHKISIASCAPCPALAYLEQLLSSVFPKNKNEKTILTESDVISGLAVGKFSLGIISSPSVITKDFSEKIQIRPIMRENLYAIIPENHELAKKNSGIFLKNIDGEAVIPFPLKGYWNDLLERKLPNSKKLYQTSIESFDAIVNATSLITFASDALPRNITGHTAIKVLDDDAQIFYQLAYLKKDENRFFPLFSAMAQTPCTMNFLRHQ